MRRSFCIATVILCLIALAAAQASTQEGAEQPSTFDERLGADDGAALAILFGANMRGNLELCDCNYPRGGLARRVGYVEGFKKKFKETPVIQVEVGNFLLDSSTVSPNIMKANEQVALAYSRWPVDVINLGRYDLFYARRLLAREGLADRKAMLPMLKNLVSANGVFDQSVAPPPAYLIKEVSGPRIKGRRGKLRVGFIGLAEPIIPAEGVDATVRNIFESARASVLRARKECDVLVVLAHAGFDTSLRLARENPEADVVISGNAEGIFKPRQVGNTLVVPAAPGNTQEGDLRLYLSPEGRVSFKFRSTNLDSVIPADPAAVAFTEAAKKP